MSVVAVIVVAVVAVLLVAMLVAPIRRSGRGRRQARAVATRRDGSPRSRAEESRIDPSFAEDRSPS